MSINQDTILYIMTTLVLFFFRDMDVHSLLPLSFSYIPTSLFKENTLIGLGLSLLAVARAILFGHIGDNTGCSNHSHQGSSPLKHFLIVNDFHRMRDSDITCIS